MAQDPVYQSLLLTAARAMGAKVDMAPTEWTGEVFNAEVLITAFIKEPLQRHNRDLPRLVGAARLDDMPVLMGELEGPPERASVNDLSRRYRNQATIARSWLGSEAANLQLFLIGPPDALSDLRWRQLAALGRLRRRPRAIAGVKWCFGLLPVLCSEQESRSSSRRLRSGSRSARKGSRDRNASIAWRAGRLASLVFRSALTAEHAER